VLLLWRRKSDAVAQLVAFYLTTDISPHFHLEIIKKKTSHNPDLSFSLVSIEKVQEKCNSYHSGMTIMSVSLIKSRGSLFSLGSFVCA